jgi:hypothetical protein
MIILDCEVGGSFPSPVRHGCCLLIFHSRPSKTRADSLFLLFRPLNNLSQLGMHPVMSDLNNTVVYQVSVPGNSSVYETSSSTSPSGFHVGTVLSQVWSLITLWRLLVLCLVIGNLKNIPLIWHVSFPAKP